MAAPRSTIRSALDFFAAASVGAAVLLGFARAQVVVLLAEHHLVALTGWAYAAAAGLLLVLPALVTWLLRNRGPLWPRVVTLPVALGLLALWVVPGTAYTLAEVQARDTFAGLAQLTPPERTARLRAHDGTLDTIAHRYRLGAMSPALATEATCKEASLQGLRGHLALEVAELEEGRRLLTACVDLGCQEPHPLGPLYTEGADSRMSAVCASELARLDVLVERYGPDLATRLFHERLASTRDPWPFVVIGPCAVYLDELPIARWPSDSGACPEATTRAQPWDDGGGRMPLHDRFGRLHGAYLATMAIAADAPADRVVSVLREIWTASPQSARRRPIRLLLDDDRRVTLLPDATPRRDLTGQTWADIAPHLAPAEDNVLKLPRIDCKSSPYRVMNPAERVLQ